MDLYSARSADSGALRFQPFFPGQLRLTLVKSPEALGFEFESASDVKTIECADAKL